MNEQKKKNFIQEHKKTIIVAGGVVTGLVLTRAIFKAGLYRGAVGGFFETIKWCDQTFPDIKLQELYDAWVLANPELVKTVKV